mmetsp:Transcript_19820/g.51521  ORF Transcript_19820/g.51521 Transcript_19820/m.51521 type:complete len:104 (+) Transcript_19820:686-997(+)
MQHSTEVLKIQNPAPLCTTENTFNVQPTRQQGPEHQRPYHSGSLDMGMQATSFINSYSNIRKACHPPQQYKNRPPSYRSRGGHARTEGARHSQNRMSEVLSLE